MFKKMTLKILKIGICLYFVVSFVMMLSCLGIICWDTVEKVHNGEFRLLPILNISQFKSNGTLDEQDLLSLNSATTYAYQLYIDGYGTRNPLWRFINISTTMALVNIPIYYLLRLFKAELPKWISKIFAITSAIVLLLIVAVRIYVYFSNCYGSFEIEICYSSAYPSWKVVFSTVVILSILTFFVKLLRKE